LSGKNLLEILNNNNDGFRKKLYLIEDLAIKCLNNIEHTFPNFTVHDIKHSYQVISYINQIIFGCQEEDFLNDIEIFILLAASYLHDTGMATGKIIIDGKEITDHQIIRDNHEEISAKLASYYSNESKDLLGKPNPIICIEEIEKVIKGHRKVNLNSDEYNNSIYETDTIRIRLLSSLLRLADELDILSYRAKEAILFSTTSTTEMNKAKLHHFKHYYVRACLVTNDIIKISYRVPDDCVKYFEVLNIIIRNKIQTVLNDVDITLRDSGIKLKLEEPERKIEESLQKMPDPVWRMAEDKILRHYNEEKEKIDNIIQLVTDNPITSGSVASNFDQTRGGYNE